MKLGAVEALRSTPNVQRGDLLPRAPAERADGDRLRPPEPFENEPDELGERVAGIPDPVWFDGNPNIF